MRVVERISRRNEMNSRFCSLHARIHGLSHFRVYLYGLADGSRNLMHEDRVKLSIDKNAGDIPVFPVSLNIRALPRDIAFV